MKPIFYRERFIKLFAGLGIISLSASIVTVTYMSAVHALAASPPDTPLWEFRSVDTMKYSRDAARQALNNTSFDTIIQMQVAEVANTGATHIAIATPYDEEFLPVVRRWVKAAREKNLKIWFRGNFSGWEKWFGYPGINRGTHQNLTRAFILKNPDLFEDGDIFTACPECENGGPGDPRMNGDLEGHRQFLIDEYAITKDAFATIGKKVASNYDSMNGDVARLVMDRPTTAALDGIVVVDHYVKSTEKLVSDLVDLGNRSGGRVVLGEFGAPIPDVNGRMSPDEQASWLNDLLMRLTKIQNFVGLNYWVGVGGSTGLWTENGKGSPAANTLAAFYQHHLLRGTITDDIGRAVVGATISNGLTSVKSDAGGSFTIPDAATSTALAAENISDSGSASMLNISDQDMTKSVVVLNSTTAMRVVLPSSRQTLLVKIINLMQQVLALQQRIFFLQRQG